MQQLSRYKYTKIRKIIDEAQVPKGVKELTRCALRQYRDGLRPVQGQFFNRNKQQACLVGAALLDHAKRLDVAKRMSLADKITHLGGGEDDDDYRPFEQIAADEFGIQCARVECLIRGFDWNSDKTTIKEEALSARISRELFGKKPA